MIRGEVAGHLFGRSLDAACRTFYHVHDAGLEHVPAAGPAVVVFSHRRDADAPLVGNRMLGRGLLGPHPLPRTMAREDLFRPGFLTAYLKGWPGWLRRPLGRVPLGPLLRLAGARPIRRVEERTLGAVLEEVRNELGNLPLDEVLRPRWLARFAEAAEGAPPRDVDSAGSPTFERLLLEPRGLTALTPACLRHAAALQRRTVGRQLEVFVAHLRSGGRLLLAPEGVVSEDGRLGRLRSALAALLDGAPETLVVPAAVTYDFMTRHRVHAHLRFGPPLTGLAELEPAAANHRVRRALLRCWTVTATQLGGSALHRYALHDRPLAPAELEQEVAEQAARCAAAGLVLAPELTSAPACERRLTDLLRWVERAGLFVQRGGLLWPTASATAPPSWRRARGSLAYSDNELAALGELLGPAPAASGSALQDLQETAH